MATFAKPENALKRAEELIHVGQKQAALQALHDLITSKRYRSWQKPLERIMMKYVELCVDLRKGRFAKDGLIQYRIVCQQVNVSSLEEVIKHFMQLSNEKAEQARNQAQALDDALDVEDLEADKRPEDLMLSYVSGEKGKDRSDREHVTPWFKFLWETYRTVLEILRNNSKLEALYAMTAHKAFQFCKQYKRTTEFRRLCEIIRNHLANLNKYRDQRDRPDLTAPESLQLYLDTRVEQLKIATDLSLWQEAFRSVEDIHGLMSMVKKTPKPSVLVVYYAKLTEIFWISDCHLYHAYAWLKLFNLQKSYNKNLSQKDLQLIASSVLLAALAVSPYDHKYGASHLELENEKDRNLRIANLVNFSLDSKRENREVPSRASLLSELAAKGVISCASQEVKDLYNLLEHESLPLDLVSKVQPMLSKIAKTGGKLSSAPSVPEVFLSQYLPALEKLTTLRVLQQASQIFQSVKIDMLSKMIPFFDFSVVEKISVDAVKHNFVAMKVNHLSGAVHFGNMDTESDCLSNHLSVLAESLNKARSLIQPPVKKPSKLGKNLTSLAGVVENEHRRLLARKSIIEKRKEDLERQILEKEKEEELKRLSTLKKSADDERLRLLNDVRLREQERIRQSMLEKEKKEAEEMLATKINKNKKGKKPVILGDVTKQAVMELAMNEQVKERQELEKKLQKIAKQMDYLERAKREEEAPLIEQAFQKRLEVEKILHEQEQLREIELSKQHHAGDLQEKNRLSRMLDHKNVFQERIVQRRESEFSRLKKERDEKTSQLISSRKRERDTVRKLMYHLNLEEQRIERLREEEEARKREEEERRKREEAERKAKLDAIAAKQLQREREMEEKERQRREALFGKGAGAGAGAEPAARTPDAAPVAQPAQPVAAPAAAAAAAAPGKYVPKFKRGGDSGSGVGSQRPTAAPEQDRWGSRDDRPRPDIRPLRQDNDMRPLRQDAPPARQDPPAGQGGPVPTWRGSRFSSSSSSSSTWSSSRPRN
ncbi:eukaryotic translation initiation factor 3 subunit A [Oryza brachyantha]|uniref:Eukaryotic translation initiation factor 3 subunit A n=1 Tax=Oryza brachyantha TaxID=4533 RepID=J3KVY1_ORYBR|nr:eukaryotic translation initiation factor 3 subunit A [Oryza brachyantha]